MKDEGWEFRVGQAGLGSGIGHWLQTDLPGVLHPVLLPSTGEAGISAWIFIMALISITR